MREINHEFTSVQIRAGKFILLREFLFRNSTKEKQINSLRNLELKGTVTHIKRGTSSKIEKKLTAWLKALHYQGAYMRATGSNNYRRAVFLTLTLPVKQFHSDIEIKREILSPFLQHLRNALNCVHFWWRAETQLNGNIHFHVLTDAYIDKFILQRDWNRHLNRLGYIDKFAEIHGHWNPPSTHIEALNDVKAVTSYVLKYVTKDESIRLIEGRKWDCSKGLKDLKVESYILDSEFGQYIDYLLVSGRATLYQDEFFSIVRCTESFSYERDYKFVEMIERSAMLEAYESLYYPKPRALPVVKPVEARKAVQLSLFSDFSPDAARMSKNYFD